VDFINQLCKEFNNTVNGIFCCSGRGHVLMV